MVRPPSVAPSIDSRAELAASSVVNVTNPKPRERPVSRSDTTFASVTSPKGVNASRRSSVVVAQARPPQNSLLLMVNSFTVQPTRRRAEAVLQFTGRTGRQVRIVPPTGAGTSLG